MLTKRERQTDRQTDRDRERASMLINFIDQDLPHANLTDVCNYITNGKSCAQYSCPLDT